MRRLVVIMLVVASTPALAQGVRRYRPKAGPTLSPYLNLLRNDVGGFPSYYALVRPLQEQDALQRETDRLAGRTQRLIREIDSGLIQSRSLATGTNARFQTTRRVDGPFQNQQRYFGSRRNSFGSRRR